MLHKRASDAGMRRQLFTMHVAFPAAVPRLDLPSANFVCLLAWDARGVSVEAIAAFVESLLRRGASCFVCWGPECERVHDIIDEIASDPDNDLGVPEGSCVMTTWHSSASLREALWFFLASTWPDEDYENSTHSAVAISIACSAWEAEIAEALDHPREFSRRVCEEDAS